MSTCEITEKPVLCAAVVNAFGDILPYTVQSTAEQVKEKAIERFGSDIWDAWMIKGHCTLKLCEIRVINPRDYSKE